jgi:hypothetical protein
MDVAQAHNPVGRGTIGRCRQSGRDPTGDLDILGEYLTCEHEDVGTLLDYALVEGARRGV